MTRARLNSQCLFLGCLSALGLLYTFMFNRYRPYDVDNPWFLSFSYNLWVHHDWRDSFRLGVFPNGMGGTIVFGKLAALSQGIVLSHAGWYPFPAFLMVLAFVLASYAAWWFFLKEAGYDFSSRGVFILVIGTLEPFVSMALKARYEYIAWFLLSLSLLLAARRFFFVAFFLAFLAVETEPIALTIPIIIALYLHFVLGWSRRIAFSCIAAFLSFIVAYSLLHPSIIEILRHTQWHSADELKTAGGFLSAYFIERKRHLPELAIVLIVFLQAWRSRHCLTSTAKFGAAAGFVVAAFAFVTKWPNASYMVFFYPFIILLGIEVFAGKLKDGLILATIAVLFLPQYGYLWWINRGEGYSRADVEEVASAIRQVEAQDSLEDSTARIYGDASLWFAHPERYTASSTPTRANAQNADIILCYNAPLVSRSMTDVGAQYCSDIERQLPLRARRVIAIQGHSLRIMTRVSGERSMVQ